MALFNSGGHGKASQNSNVVIELRWYNFTLEGFRRGREVPRRRAEAHQPQAGYAAILN